MTCCHKLQLSDITYVRAPRARAPRARAWRNFLWCKTASHLSCVVLLALWAGVRATGLMPSSPGSRSAFGVMLNSNQPPLHLPGDLQLRHRGSPQHVSQAIFLLCAPPLWLSAGDAGTQSPLWQITECRRRARVHLPLHNVPFFHQIELDECWESQRLCLNCLLRSLRLTTLSNGLCIGGTCMSLEGKASKQQLLKGGVQVRALCCLCPPQQAFSILYTPLLLPSPVLSADTAALSLPAFKSPSPSTRRWKSIQHQTMARRPEGAVSRKVTAIHYVRLPANGQCACRQMDYKHLPSVRTTLGRCFHTHYYRALQRPNR